MPEEPNNNKKRKTQPEPTPGSSDSDSSSDNSVLNLTGIKSLGHLPPLPEPHKPPQPPVREVVVPVETSTQPAIVSNGLSIVPNRIRYNLRSGRRITSPAPAPPPIHREPAEDSSTSHSAVESGFNC